MMPPVTRSVSVPDTGSIWELQSASQPTGKMPGMGQICCENFKGIECCVIKVFCSDGRSLNLVGNLAMFH